MLCADRESSRVMINEQVFKDDQANFCRYSKEHGSCINCRGRHGDVAKEMYCRCEDQVSRSGCGVLGTKGPCALPKADHPLRLAALAKAHTQIPDLMILIMLQRVSHGPDRLEIFLYSSIGMSSLQLFTCNSWPAARTQRLLTIP